VFDVTRDGNKELYFIHVHDIRWKWYIAVHIHGVRWHIHGRILSDVRLSFANCLSFQAISVGAVDVIHDDDVSSPYLRSNDESVFDHL